MKKTQKRYIFRSGKDFVLFYYINFKLDFVIKYSVIFFDVMEDYERFYSDMPQVSRSSSARVCKSDKKSAMLELCLIYYTRKNLTTCSKSANKPLTSCVRTACFKLSTSLEQVVNNL